jgi:hypothetical protein
VPSGRRADILALFDNKVTWGSVKHWRKGRRNVPMWAIECLRRRTARLDELMPGPGQGASWRRWRESQPAVYREKQGKRSVVYRDKPKSE